MKVVVTQRQDMSKRLHCHHNTTTRHGYEITLPLQHKTQGMIATTTQHNTTQHNTTQHNTTQQDTSNDCSVYFYTVHEAHYNFYISYYTVVCSFYETFDQFLMQDFDLPSAYTAGYTVLCFHNNNVYLHRQRFLTIWGQLLLLVTPCHFDGTVKNKQQYW